MAPSPSLLCVANFPSNTGYAWDFIESLYARVADQFRERQIRTFVSYPEILSPPRTLIGSSAQAVLLDATLESRASVDATVRFVRENNVRVVYSTDRATWSFNYVRLRAAGVRWIVVHDHASGERKPPKGPKFLAKWLLTRLPWINADAVVTVSDYVARHHFTVGLQPRKRLLRVWNGIPVRQTRNEDRPAD